MALTEASAFKDGSIVNDDVKSDAAIAGSKISPDFGSQNIVTTGTLGSNDITISDITPRLTFTDSDNNLNYRIKVNVGHFVIEDATNTTDKFKINTDGHIDLIGNVDISSGLDVTGNITVTGTVDGRDIATDGTKLDTLSVPITPAVEVTQRTNDFSTQSTSYQTVMSVTITPNSSSSKLLVIAGGSFQGLTDSDDTDDANARVKLFRGSTEIGTLSSVTGSKTGFYLVNKDTNNHGGNAVTYHLKLRRAGGNNQASVMKGSSLLIQEII